MAAVSWTTQKVLEVAKTMSLRHHIGDSVIPLVVILSSLHVTTNEGVTLRLAF